MQLEKYDDALDTCIKLLYDSNKSLFPFHFYFYAVRLYNRGKKTHSLTVQYPIIFCMSDFQRQSDCVIDLLALLQIFKACECMFYCSLLYYLSSSSDPVTLQKNDIHFTVIRCYVCKRKN